MRGPDGAGAQDDFLPVELGFPVRGGPADSHGPCSPENHLVDQGSGMMVRFSRLLAGARYATAVLTLARPSMLKARGPTPVEPGRLWSGQWGNRRPGRPGGRRAAAVPIRLPGPAGR